MGPRPSTTTWATSGRAARGRAAGGPGTRWSVVLVGVALTVGVALGGGGCALRQDEAPREIARDSLPRVLFQENDSVPTAPESANEVRPIYLVRSGDDSTENLIAVPLTIPDPDNAADLPRAILEKLVKPGLKEDSEFTSAIPPGTQVRSVTRDGDVLQIDLSNLIVEGTGQRLAFAQFVFTATAIEGIRAVRFTTDGNSTAVPLGDQNSEPGQLISRDDYPKLNAAVTTATSSSTSTSTSTTTTATGAAAPAAAADGAATSAVPSLQAAPADTATPAPTLAPSQVPAPTAAVAASPPAARPGTAP